MANFDMRNEAKMSGISQCLEILIKILLIDEDHTHIIIKKGFIELLSNFILETKVSSKEANRMRMIRKTCQLLKVIAELQSKVILT